MTVQTRRKEDGQASRHEPGWPWLAQVALALILFCLISSEVLLRYRIRVVRRGRA